MPEAARDVVTEGEQVERSRGGHGHGRARGQERRERDQRVGGARRPRAAGAWAAGAASEPTTQNR